MHNGKIIESGQIKDQASKALVMLHGRGGTAQGILELTADFCDDTFYVVAPQAPNNSWYPQSFMAEEKFNASALEASVETIMRVIIDTEQYIPRDQIYLMGFSQGACLALEVAARFAGRYGAIVAFSGALIGERLDEKKYQGNFAGTKIFIGISENDPHVPLARAVQSKQLLEKMGADTTLMAYPGISHTISQEEIVWVQKNFFGK